MSGEPVHLAVPETNGCEFHILGPLEISRAGTPVKLPPPRSRAVLAVLLVHANHVVSVDQLCDEVWHGHPPDTARAAVQVHISTLRRALGLETLLRTQHPGYVLDVDDDQVDALRFERELARGRAALSEGDQEAVEELRRALSMWRGPALPEFAEVPCARLEAARLEELHAAALADRIDGDLAHARHGEVIAELQQLVGEQPYRERFHGQLMLALYRDGRQAEALDAYRQARATLVDELGIEPSSELRNLHQAILDQDPALGSPNAAAQSPLSVTLPAPTASLHGREADVEALARMVSQLRTRLVTLVGPGGVGKTTLALETARHLAPDFADGACLVELASVSEPSETATAIARALGMPVREQELPDAALRRVLAPCNMLLVLDNFEHLLEGAALVGELLAACPRVTIVVTSREPTRLGAEHVYPVSPLAIPPAIVGQSPGEMESYGSVAMFRDRAQARDPTFMLDDTTAPDVADVCRRLDGLPLALELAAARIGPLSVSELSGRLGDALEILTTAARDAPARQRTLRRTMDWSYDLLGSQARAVLRRLAVFAGSFDLDTAESVCVGEGVAQADVAELLWTLVDSSLVVREPAAGMSRYSLLSTVRAYAASRSGAEEHAAALGRLADRYHDLVGPHRAGMRRWVEVVALELDNLRQVAAELPDDAAAQALAWSIGRYHELNDAFRVGIEELTRWTQRLPTDGPNRVALLTLLANLHLSVGELDRAEVLVAEAAELRAMTGPAEWDAAGVARTRAELALRRGDATAATREARAALAEPQSEQSRALLHNVLGGALVALGDIEGAAAAFEQELACAKAAGMETYLATSYGNLAEAQLRLGNESAAAGNQAASLELARADGKPLIVAFAMNIAARLAAARQQPHQAVVLQTAADRVFAEASFAFAQQDLEVRAALLQGARGDLGEVAYEQAVTDARNLDPDAAADLAASVLQAVCLQATEQSAS